MTQRANDLADIKAALADNAESLLLDLNGEPSQRSRREWRWGNKGSRSFRFDSARYWDFELEDGGSVLDAIRLANNISLPAAIEWGRAWLGEDPAQRPAPKPQPKRAAPDRNVDQDEARELWRTGRSIHGTAAARYLQARAIDGWPDNCVRFIGARDVQRIATSADGHTDTRKAWGWWNWPALMFAMTNAAGDVCAVQLVALQDDGTAIEMAGRKVKFTHGVKAGAAVRLPGDPDGPLVVAEGGETAASVWLATGYETFAILGSWRQAPLDDVPLGRAIVVARDDDPRTPKTKHIRRRQRETIAEWRALGRHVVEAQPWPLSRGDKSDFNDALKAGGPDAVRERIEHALRPYATVEGIRRPEALMRLSSAVGRCVRDCLQWHGDGETTAPFKVIRASTAMGKSQLLLEEIVLAIKQGHRVGYAAPAHKLTAELQARAVAEAKKRGVSVKVRVWYGRESEDPGHPGQSMCQDLEPVKLAQQARISVGDTVCTNCQFKDDCSYVQQRADASVNLWIVPHALLASEMPPPLKGISLLVVDEGFALDGLIGMDGAPLIVRVDRLADQATHGSGDAARSADLNAVLLPLRRHLIDAAADHPASKQGEPLRRSALPDLTPDMADAARKQAARQRRDVSAIAAATRGDLLRELRLIKTTNVAAIRERMLWRHVHDFLADEGAGASGRVELVTVDDSGHLADDGHKAFRLFGVEEIRKGWRSVPTVHVDATGDMALINRRVPHAELVESIDAAEPNVIMHQVVGPSFGKASLKGSGAVDALRFAQLKQAEHGGRWLIIANKEAADIWRDQRPDNIDIVHWGNLRGLDAYKDVAGIVITGRWGVRPDAVGRIAAILSGRAVPRLDGWYPSDAITLTAADGSSRTVDADRHPDALAEAVRRAVVESELVQGIGRGRGGLRGPDNPLTVYVLGNTPTPFPLASISDWQPITHDQAMIADFGAWLESAGDMAGVMVAAGLAGSAQGVKKARQRMGTASYNKSLKDAVPHLPWLAAATYQRSGPGRSHCRLLYVPGRIADPQAWLEARLGPLVHFELHELPDAPEPAEILPMVDQVPAPMVVGFDLPEAKPPSEIASHVNGIEVGLSADVEPDDADQLDPLRDYAGGIMSTSVASFVRRAWRKSDMTQDQLANLAGISRPQLANALAGRFGLSSAAADRLRAALTDLPPPSQGTML